MFNLRLNKLLRYISPPSMQDRKSSQAAAPLEPRGDLIGAFHTFERGFNLT